MNGDKEQMVNDPTQDVGTSEESATRDQHAAPAPSADAGLKVVVEKLTQEKNQLTDLLQRKQAELENFRKRTQREKGEMTQHANADLIHTLLPTLDALDRALAHRSEGVPKQFFQGLELIRKELMDVLGRAGLVALEAVGETFDPHVHHAVEMVEAREHRDQEIVEELQRGYLFKKRLLRPAIVKVAVVKGDSETAGSGNSV